MLSQNVKMLSYSKSVGTTFDVPAKVYVGRVKTSIAFRDVKMILLILLLPLAVTYCFRLINDQERYVMRNLRTEVIELSRENARLKLEVAGFEAPTRIQEIAEKELGMEMPSTAIYGMNDVKDSHRKIRD